MGWMNCEAFLKAFVKSPAFDTVSSMGIVRDAENSAASAFQSVHSSLTNVGLPAPSGAGQRFGDSPAVTVLILPGDDNPGMLETLLCQTFADAPVNRCIDDFFRVRWLPARPTGQGSCPCIPSDEVISRGFHRRGGAKRLLAPGSRRLRRCPLLPENPVETHCPGIRACPPIGCLLICGSG